MEKPKSEKLKRWQDRLAASEREYKPRLDEMDKREALYRGDHELKPLTPRDAGRSGGRCETPHVRNIIAENIESQINSSIPQPKVTARRKKDERLAKLIEDMLRNELDRLPMEYLNDIQERTIPIQGGGFYHVEWDSAQRTHTTAGEVTIAPRHPKQIIPQPGVYTAIEDMDYFFLKLPQTKESIRRRYGVDVLDEGESEPEVRSSGGACPKCGGRDWESREEEYQELWEQVFRSDGTTIPGAQASMDPLTGAVTLTPTKIPYYKPGVYPLVLQRNVSVFGQLLGESDA